MKQYKYSRKEIAYLLRVQQTDEGLKSIVKMLLTTKKTIKKWKNSKWFDEEINDSGLSDIGKEVAGGIKRLIQIPPKPKKEKCECDIKNYGYDPNCPDHGCRYDEQRDWCYTHKSAYCYERPPQKVEKIELPKNVKYLNSSLRAWIKEITEVVNYLMGVK